MIASLNAEINAVIAMPEVSARLLTAGIEPLGGTPDQLRDIVRSDDQRYGTLAKSLKITAD
jgi:tripartite-type tricarboxylate transporter receptor subunit TctC